jgi:hypothetical protein
MPTWLDLTLAGWRIVSRRITGVSPAGYSLEVVARATWQPVSRAHLFVFNVTGHEEPLATLRPDSGTVVEAVSALATAWAPVKVKP